MRGFPGESPGVKIVNNRILLRGCSEETVRLQLEPEVTSVPKDVPALSRAVTWVTLSAAQAAVVLL